jgi:hypothetical protein
MGERHQRGYRCYERLKAKTGRFKNLVHTRWSGGRGDLSTGKWIGVGCGRKKMIL